MSWVSLFYSDVSSSVNVNGFVSRPFTLSRGVRRGCPPSLLRYVLVSYWNQTLQHSRKLSFYHSIKKKYSLSAYVDSTRKNPTRRTLVKLRIGCHNLRVETGRYDKIPLEERICPLCSGNEIEDETHLLLDCQGYSSMRDIFLSKIETKIDDIQKLSHENLISQLMNSNDYYVNLWLIMFISSCFEMRNKLIWPLLKYWMNVMTYIYHSWNWTLIVKLL